MNQTLEKVGKQKGEVLYLLITLQDFFVADQFATTKILTVGKYGKIEQKPSHFGRHKK